MGMRMEDIVIWMDLMGKFMIRWSSWTRNMEIHFAIKDLSVSIPFYLQKYGRQQGWIQVGAHD